jgi:outer membrane lipoprotein-sorting protein
MRYLVLTLYCRREAALIARPAVSALSFCAALLLESALIPMQTRAADAGDVAADSPALVRKAEAYLDGLRGAEGGFTQTDPRGQVTHGRFFMLKPGRARFQYDPPAGLLVVSDGANVSIYDRKLKTFDQYPLAQTPLALLLSRDVDFEGRVLATVADQTPKSFALDLRDAKHPSDGRLRLDFSASPMALTGWTVVDAQNQRTTVKLSGLTVKSAFAPGLFVLHNPAPTPQY